MTLRFLLDTNVVSEPLRAAPDPALMKALRKNERVSAIPAVVWHELRFGWARLPPSRRKEAIGAYLSRVVEPCFAVLPYERRAAEWHALERARLAGRGESPSFADAQIAAIAVVHGLAVVTANRADFARFAGLEVVDWRGR